MEIYIENIVTSDVVTWLDSSFCVVGGPVETGDAEVISTIIGEETVPVVVTCDIEDTKFTGIWFDSQTLPWSTVKDLAKVASNYYQSKIRYEKNDLSLVFYELFNGKVSEIIW